MTDQTRPMDAERGKVVWLKDGWATTVHSTDGAVNRTLWATKCGLKIQHSTDGQVKENGLVIAWRLLNHDEVSPCAKCFPTKGESNGR